MKKLFLVLSVTLASINVFAGEDKDKKDDEQMPNPIPVVAGEYGDIDKVRPRSLEPFTCYIISNEVVLEFTADLGVVEVVVTSLTTGEQWFACGDAADGAIRVEASNEPGNYVVQIYAENGGSWYGCFSL